MKLKLIILTIPLVTFSALPPASKRMRFAVTRGKIRNVRQCLSTGESPICIWPKGGMSPLMIALKWNQIEISQLFTSIQLTDQAKLKNDNGQTPLHFAAETANISVLAALLDAQVEINIKDENGISPLYAAVKGLKIYNKPEHIQAIKLLLSSGAYTFSEEKKLWDLVLSAQNQEVIQLLAPYFTKRKIE